MLEFVMGFFREYWPLVVMCVFGQFCTPRIVDWQFRRRIEKEKQHAAKH
ncbi:hypothetical protein AWB72_00805 [Caballeronia concitans]|uniref:Uncharacterized protein n=1 Tax=Caballeronia concitans TaxID=1777133 RepID=A0A658QS33_9BURK|nr:hypothetical protein BurMR1_4156 [Burkholderia sp. MR1]SAL15310.1 hypothetical protein AWB72_00805 [Caballeronia concitans]